MKRKVLLFLTLVLCLFVFVGCDKSNDKAVGSKKDTIVIAQGEMLKH